MTILIVHKGAIMQLVMTKAIKNLRDIGSYRFYQR